MVDTFENTLTVFENTYPDAMLVNRRKEKKTSDLVMRWNDLFKILPGAKMVNWNHLIHKEAEGFYDSVGLKVLPDSTSKDEFREIVANTDGICMRWSVFAEMLPVVEKFNWSEITDLY